MSASDAKVVKREPLDPSKAKWVKLTSITYNDPNQRTRLWESAERTTRPGTSSVDAVGIVTILEKPSGPEMLLQKQFRAPVGQVCIEIPAGLVDEGESVETCAVRELKEETGYAGSVVGSSNEQEHWGVGPVIFNDPGFTNTNLRMVHVRVDMNKEENQNPKPELEPGEFIETFSVPLKELYEECRRLEGKGYAIDARVGTLAEGIEIARRWKI